MAPIMTTNTIRLLIIACSCFLFQSAMGQVYLTRTGTVKFVSDAPLELITASSNDLAGAINIQDNRFAFKIDNRSFVGFNSPLQQEHFYENYIEVDKYKSSTFQGKIIEQISPDTEGPAEVRAKGVFSIHGVEHERLIKGTLEFAGERLLLKASFTVPLEDYNIRIPNVVYQKIAENIQVYVEAEFTRQPE